MFTSVNELQCAFAESALISAGSVPSRPILKRISAIRPKPRDSHPSALLHHRPPLEWRTPDDPTPSSHGQIKRRSDSMMVNPIRRLPGKAEKWQAIDWYSFHLISTVRLSVAQPLSRRSHCRPSPVHCCIGSSPHTTLYSWQRRCEPAKCHKTLDRERVRLRRDDRAGSNGPALKTQRGGGFDLLTTALSCPQ